MKQMNGEMEKVLFVLIPLLGLQLEAEANTITWPSAFSVEGLWRDESTHSSMNYKHYFSQNEKAMKVDLYDGMITYMHDFKDPKTPFLYYYFFTTNDTAVNVRNCIYGPYLDDKLVPHLPGLENLKYSRNITVNGAPVQEWTEINRSNRYEETVWIRMADNDTTVPIPVMHSQRLIYGVDEQSTLQQMHHKREYYNYQPHEPAKSVWNRPRNVECVWPQDEETLNMMKNVEQIYMPWFTPLSLSNVQPPLQVLNRYQKGFKPCESNSFVSELPFPYSVDEIQSKAIQLPDTVDWRLSGAVTSVKNQGFCNSCWAFGIVGAMEGAYFLQTGILGDMSVQALVDCGWWNDPNTNDSISGCRGGCSDAAFDWIKKHGGLPWAADYGDYIAQNGRCVLGSVKPVAPIKGFVHVKPDVDAVKVALYEHGPLTIAVAAHAFSGYHNGVIKGSCNSSNVDHSILLIGYGTLNGEDYWLIKNSWGEGWGLRGYGLISTKNNAMCVLNYVYYPVLEGNHKHSA